MFGEFRITSANPGGDFATYRDASSTYMDLMLDLITQAGAMVPTIIFNRRQEGNQLRNKKQKPCVRI